MCFESMQTQAFIEVLPLRVWKYKDKQRVLAFKELILQQREWFLLSTCESEEL